MIEDALPEEMRGRNITFDKKNMSTLLKELADKHPDKYVDVTKKLSDIGRQVATETGGYSIGLSHLKQMAGTKKTINEIRQKLTGFLADSKLNDKQRNEAIIRSVGGYQQSLMDDVYKEGLAAKNPIAMQIMSGSRGNKMNLSSLLGSDLLYEDHRGDIIPVPVLKSYSQGLTPAEYWAGTYGARKSIISTKFATADAGFFGKQLNQVTHRLSVVDQDDPRQDLAVRGLPVDTDDMDNEGALLAHDFGGYKRNTVLTPKILKDLKARDFSRILVRSPMTGGSPDGGVYARDVGVRERGTLPGRGEMVGMTAAQAVAEPISQGQLSAKHSGGVAGQEKTVGGFQYINQLIQVPKTFKGGAAHTTIDGRVQKIEDAPAGGKYVFINDKPQYVGSGFDLKVKPGDDVEAGDIISEGMPNPSIITEHKGIGEGRKYFVKAFRDSMGSMGLRSHRRNIELIGRGLIDHVRMTEEYGDHVPDDVIPYSTLEHGYKPREGFQTLEPSRALNKYLEKPVLHYSIGTKVRPSMLKDMQYFGIKDVTVHDKPAPFQPEMVRAMYNLHHDPDWMTRMYGSGLKSSLLDATHRGSTSSATGTSFVPGLAKSVDFGRVGQVRQSEPGLKPDLNTPVATPMTPNTDTEKSSSDALYHGSSLKLKNIEPRPSRVINNEAAVFGTPNRELALSFMAPWTDADLSLGSTNNEPYVLEERYPGAFEKIYKGKSGFLHHLPSTDFAEDPRLMPTERIARKAVKPINVEEIKNLWDALQTSGIVLKRHGAKSNNKVANDDILPQQHIKFAEVYTANGDSVQGVGLRKLYHTLLDEKGISGLGVNNEETGNVELAFNGDEAQRKNVFDELAARIQAKTGKPVTFAPLAVPQQMTSVNLSNADAARLNAIHHLAYRMSNMYDPSDSAMHDDATFKQNMADRFRLSVTDKGLTGTVPSRAAEQLLGTRPMYSAMAPEHRVRDEDEAMKDMAPEHKQKLLSMLGTDRGFLSNTAGINKKVEKKSAYSIADGIANVRRKDDTLSQLLEAKKHSDAKRYDHKNAILRKLMQQSPQDWIVDDADAKHYGVTHKPTSFRLHTDPNVIPAEVTRQKQGDDSAIKPTTGSSTNPAPAAPKAPTAPAPVTAPMTPGGSTAAPKTAPKPYQTIGMGPKKFDVMHGMTQQQIYEGLQTNNMNSSLGKAEQQRMNRDKADRLYKGMQLQGATGSNNASGTFQQGQLTSASPVQTPPPITPQQTTPIAGAPPTTPPATQQPSVPKTTPITDPPEPPPAPSSTYTPPAPMYAKQDDNILPEPANPVNPFKMVGQTLKDISTLTGVGRRDPNVNWSFDAMGAGEHDTNAAAAASSTQTQAAKTEAEQLEQKKTELAQKQQEETAKATFAERDANISPLGRVGAYFGAPFLIDKAKTALGFGAPAAATAAADATAAAAKAAPPTTWVGRGQQLATGARNMVTTQAQNAVQTARGVAAAPVTSAGKGLLSAGRNAVNLAKSPFMNPITSILIDGVLTAVENPRYGAIMANSDKWGDRTKSLGEHASGIGTEFGKGNILAGLQNIGMTGYDAAAMAYGAALSPVESAQTGMYSLASGGRYTQQGQSMRRNDKATDPLKQPTIQPLPQDSVSRTGDLVDKSKQREAVTARNAAATAAFDAQVSPQNPISPAGFDPTLTPSKGLPGFGGYTQTQDPAWTDYITPRFARGLIGGKIRENVPVFKGPVSPEVIEDTRKSLTLRTTIESMPLDQQQKFIVGLMDNPEHKIPDADGKTHIQKTFERLTLAKQQELLDLYKNYQAGAVVPRPAYDDDTSKQPAVRMSQAEANQQQAAVAAKQEATRRKYQYQRPRQ